ncbi:retrovirus-related pol polyprotein from transposon TNT 1-94 [Tanacetum coccineum]
MSTTDKNHSRWYGYSPQRLEESDFDSWKIRIQRYIRGKPNGKLIWNSIKNGPTPHPTTTDTTGEGEQQTQVIRKKRDDEFTEAENIKELADIQAINILSQGLPNTYSHLAESTETAQESGRIYETTCHETLSKMNQSSGNTDPLAYMAQATKTSSHTSSQQYSPYVPPQSPQSTNDAMLATMNQIVNLLSGFQKRFQSYQQQLRTSNHPMNPPTPPPTPQATIQAGQITTKNVQQRDPSNKGKQIATGSQGKLVTCYNCRGQGHIARECKEKKRDRIHTCHEDAYDSDVDEAPYAAAAFMANLTGTSNREGTNNNTDFHSEPALYRGDIVVNPLHTPHRVHDNEDTLVHAEVSRTKMLEKIKDPECPIIYSPINYAKLNNLYDTFVPQKELTREQAYWLPANEVASNQSKPAQQFVHTRPAKSQVNSHLKTLKSCFPEFDECLEIENKNLLIQNECLLAESISKDICSVVLTPDNVVPISVEPCSNCDKEQTRNLELEAEFSKVKQLLVCNNLNSPELNIFFEINKLKEQLQGKDNTIGKLKAQINNMKDVSTGPSLSTLEIENTKLKEELTAVRIKNDSLRDENVSIKERFQELYKSKAGSNSSVSSGATILVKPKAVASGLYAMTPKYVPPQKRINRETNSSLPRKETVTVVDLSNVPVNLPTGIKSVPDASKSKSKSDKKIHKNLPARSKKVKRVAKPPRNLNKNRVDSSLNDKHTGFILKSVSVCKTCNECLVFGNHDECVVKSMNAKKPKDQKPEVVSIANSGSVRTSKPTNNVTVTPRFSEKTLTSYKRKDRNTKGHFHWQSLNIETMAANILSIVYPCRSYWYRMVIQIILWYVDSGAKAYGPVIVPKLITTKNNMLEASPVCLLSKASSTKSWLWHRRLNHLNFGTLNELARKDLVRGLPKLKYEKEHLCPSCQLGKNLSFITLHGKTYYEMLKGKKPEVNYFRVFGSLCYPTNDYDDLGKLKLCSIGLGLNSMAPEHINAGSDVNQLQS